MIQWLRLHTSSVAVMGLIHGEGTKIPQAIQYGQCPPTKKKTNKKTTSPKSYKTLIQYVVWILKSWM